MPLPLWSLRRIPTWSAGDGSARRPPPARLDGRSVGISAELSAVTHWRRPTCGAPGCARAWRERWEPRCLRAARHPLLDRRPRRLLAPERRRTRRHRGETAAKRFSAS